MTDITKFERALADDLSAYVNDKHTQEEFIDGYKAALTKLKNLRLADVVGRSEQLPCEHPYHSIIGEEHGNPKCLKCSENL